MVLAENGDSPMNVVQETEYYPFGLAIPRSGTDAVNKYTFLGREKQPETGYIDLMARFYDPSIGRFFNIDPETEGQLEFSPYHYSFNNPVRFSDPDGRFPECCGGAVDFLTGVGQALNDNVLGGSPVTATPGNVEAYNNGRTFGHGLSIVGGIVATLKGAGDFLAGGGALILSGGSAAPVAVPAMGVGMMEAGIGLNTWKNASNNLKNDKGKVNAEGRSNPKKEARERAREKREEQPASEKRAKDFGRQLEKEKGKDARRNAHDAKDKMGKDRSLKELKEDYNPKNH